MTKEPPSKPQILPEWFSPFLSATSLLFLAIICIFYTWPAIRSPWFGGLDSFSNLLPVIHYKISILQEHTFPWYTDLWYGGRLQWENPLWNFFYFPATLIWLMLPLNTATIIIVVGHLILASWIGWSLTGIFFNGYVEKILGGLLFIAPIVVAIYLGHFEKLLAWPWVLLGLKYLLTAEAGNFKHGIVAGISLGMIALAGANYYVLYAGISFTILSIWQKTKIFQGLVLGSLTGLLHVPSVLFLIGESRGTVAETIETYQLSFPQIIQVLFWGMIDGPTSFESNAHVGLAFGALFLISFLWAIANKALHTKSYRLVIPLSLITLIFIFLTTGSLYQGHQLLNTFRVPVRAMAFIMTIFVLITFTFAQEMATQSSLHRAGIIVLLCMAVFQSMGNWWQVRPTGYQIRTNDPQIQNLIRYLDSAKSKDVWLNRNRREDMILHIALNMAGYRLPNAYYGQMNQSIPIEGNHCGYSFDHILIEAEQEDPPDHKLWGDTFHPQVVLGSISYKNLDFILQAPIGESTWNLYQVGCD